MRLIDADNIIEFPFLPSSGTQEVLYDIICKNIPDNMIIGNEEYLLNICNDVIDAFLNVVRTEPTVNCKPIIHAHWTGVFSNECSHCHRCLDEIMDTEGNYTVDRDVQQEIVCCPFCGATID